MPDPNATDPTGHVGWRKTPPPDTSAGGEEPSPDTRAGGETPSPDTRAGGEEPLDPLHAAADALARARASARARGLRPGAPGSLKGRRGTERDQPGQGLTTARLGADARDPQPLGREVERLVATRGWDGEVQIGAVVGRWRLIVGDTVAEHVTPVGFDETTLTVQADSTAWATQMKLLTSSVLARIDTEVGPSVVTEIVVHGPGGPSWRKGPLSSRGPGPRDTYG